MRWKFTFAVESSILVVLCLAFGVLGGGCNRSSGPSITPSQSGGRATSLQGGPYLTVEALVANPRMHSHTIVAVTGFYMHGFETSILWSCGSLKQGQAIWVESPGLIEELTKLSQLRKGPTVPKLLFKYVEARDSRTRKKLLGQQRSVSEVVLLGQFEAAQKDSGFGHAGAYANELILEDVLSSRPPDGTVACLWQRLEQAGNQEVEPEPKLPPEYIESLRKRDICEQRLYDKKIFSVHGMSVMEACKENPDRKP